MKNLEVVTEYVSHRNDGWKKLKAQLDDLSPAFIVYDYEFETADKRATDRMYFIYWRPANVSQTDKIVYSQRLAGFRGTLAGVDPKDVADEDELEDLLATEVHDPRRLAKE